MSEIALVFGGPSKERGISVNSARCVFDNINKSKWDVRLIYVDSQRRPCLLPTKFIYSNTPEDFDFFLEEHVGFKTFESLRAELSNLEMTFPLIHGEFGEDGDLQELLEKQEMPFIGSGSHVCELMFDKHKAQSEIERIGECSIPGLMLECVGDFGQVAEFIGRFHDNNGEFIVKPTRSGSSICVFEATSQTQIIERTAEIFRLLQVPALVQPKQYGVEFSTTVIETASGPVALMPIEIRTDGVFDYRKKYLATEDVEYLCPPAFDSSTIIEIRSKSENIFNSFGMKDFARIDGWVRSDGKIVFSDLNPISGLGQNSLLFIQAAQSGFSHQDVIELIIENACDRYGVFVSNRGPGKSTKCFQVPILFGGDTSERQVSVLSGTNAWLKLNKSKTIEPIPMLLCKQGDQDEFSIRKLDFSVGLFPTVENIDAACKRKAVLDKSIIELSENIRSLLGSENKLTRRSYDCVNLDVLKRYTFVFLALHGGFGEGGGIQEFLDQHEVFYNGTNPEHSRLCADKGRTGEFIDELGLEGIRTAKRIVADNSEFKSWANTDFSSVWDDFQGKLLTGTIIVKPVADGCSIGIARLHDCHDLESYVEALIGDTEKLEIGDGLETQRISLPSETPARIIFEEFIATDQINVDGSELMIKDVSGWVEVTIGVLCAEGKPPHSLNPSLTVSQGDVLSLEEKFQYGTGVNLTPPPPKIMSQDVVQQVKKRIQRLAEALHIRSFARIDAFVHRKTGRLIVIEVNTIPGLTSATVLFHQLMAEDPPITATDFFEMVINSDTERNAH